MPHWRNSVRTRQRDSFTAPHLPSTQSHQFPVTRTASRETQKYSNWRLAFITVTVLCFIGMCYHYVLNSKYSNISTAASKSGLESLRTALLRPLPIVKVDLLLPSLRDTPGTTAASPLAFYLDNVFTPLECREMIRLTESVGYGAALINVGGRQKLISDIRNSGRCMIDDHTVAQRLFERIAPFLPQQMDMPPDFEEDDSGSVSTPRVAHLVGLNERLRFLRYTKGQQFQAHYDGSYHRFSTEQTPYPERSFITVQLYLNDGEGSEQPEFSGGSTAFVLNEDYISGTKLDEDRDEYPDSMLVHCHPRAGRVLVFQHRLLHQGSPVTSGVKYCLRTDAMFRPYVEEHENGAS